MAMNMAGSPGGGRRGRRRAVMAEINVTPMVDVMLVLLIIFMVAAPLDDRRRIDIDLPVARRKSPGSEHDAAARYRSSEPGAAAIPMSTLSWDTRIPPPTCCRK